MWYWLLILLIFFSACASAPVQRKWERKVYPVPNKEAAEEQQKKLPEGDDSIIIYPNKPAEKKDTASDTVEITETIDHSQDK